MSKEQQRNERWQECDFYAALGLPASASQAEVKKGFRKIAVSCHPDKVPPEAREDATRRFQLIAEAYEVLSNPALRCQYDALRPAGHGGSKPSARSAQASRYPAQEDSQRSDAGGAPQGGQRNTMNPNRGGGP